jgi:hypothetical protein
MGGFVMNMLPVSTTMEELRSIFRELQDSL